MLKARLRFLQIPREIKVANPAPPSIPEIECGQMFNFSGTAGEYVYQINLGTGTGQVFFDFEAYGVPDKFIIEWNGSEVINTGWMGLQAFNFVLTNNNIDDGIANKTTYRQSFNKTVATPTTASVTVNALAANTLWNLTAFCPDALLPLPLCPFLEIDDYSAIVGETAILLTDATLVEIVENGSYQLKANNDGFIKFYSELPGASAEVWSNFFTGERQLIANLSGGDLVRGALSGRIDLQNYGEGFYLTIENVSATGYRTNPAVFAMTIAGEVPLPATYYLALQSNCENEETQAEVVGNEIFFDANSYYVYPHYVGNDGISSYIVMTYDGYSFATAYNTGNGDYIDYQPEGVCSSLPLYNFGDGQPVAFGAIYFDEFGNAQDSLDVVPLTAILREFPYVSIENFSNPGYINCAYSYSQSENEFWVEAYALEISAAQPEDEVHFYVQGASFSPALHFTINEMPTESSQEFLGLTAADLSLGDVVNYQFFYDTGSQIVAAKTIYRLECV